MSTETTLRTFIQSLYAEHGDKLQNQDVAEAFLETFITDLKTKKPSGRSPTQPGDAFNSELCRCRVWNKGYAKQCSSGHKEGGFCTSHNKKIAQYDGWAFGLYDEEKPNEYLFDLADKKTGHSLKWKEASKAPSKVLTAHVIGLKVEYKQLIGRDPKGPKANNAEWLQTKIDEHDPAQDTKKSSGKKITPEVQALKDEYKEVFGDIPKGPKTNDAEWLKMKIKDQKVQTDSSDEEVKKSDDEEVKESDDEEVKESDEEEVKESDEEVKESDEEEVKKKSKTKKSETKKSETKKSEQSNKSSLDSDLPPPHPDGVEAKKRKEKKKSETKKSETKKKSKTKKSKTDEAKPLELELDLDMEGKKFDFEGISYWKRKEEKKQNVYNEDDMLVGRWSKKSNRINFSDGWEECHQARK